MDGNDIVELFQIALPVITTIVTYRHSDKTAKKHAAKQSILQMIMEDYIMWERKKFPVNYGRIVDEYAVYHANGGNGEVTKKVEEYKNWYTEIEESLRKKEQ